jgi:hypothetical protein
MRMKIAGVVTERFDKKTGLVKGDAIELTIDKKGEFALKEAVAEKSELGKSTKFVKEFKFLTPVVPTQKGERFFKKYSNNSYTVRGEVVISTIERHPITKRETLLPDQKKTFVLTFCDCLSELNQPDLKVEKLELK